MGTSCSEVNKSNLSAQAKCLFCAFVLTGAFALSVVYAAVVSTEEKQAGEQCIMCHVDLYNSALTQPFTHNPFIEHQCTACHLATGRDVAAFTQQTEKDFITGTRVSQDLLWRKQQKFGGDSRTFDHLVSLSGLNPAAAYRFRILTGETPDQSSSASFWLGLRSQDLASVGSGQISVADGVAGRDGTIKLLMISSVTEDAIIISWQTAQPLYGWLELQPLENADPLAIDSQNRISGSPAETHPPLRESAEAAINACYRCHPESALGTSHPVRLYGGRNVRIPEELPTVDGMLTCVTCHDPHGAPGKMLVREIIKTKLCVTCHYKYKNSSPSTMFR